MVQDVEVDIDGRDFWVRLVNLHLSKVTLLNHACLLEKYSLGFQFLVAQLPDSRSLLAPAISDFLVHRFRCVFLHVGQDMEIQV